MKSSCPALYPNETVSERVTAYSEAHSLGLPPHIKEYHAHIEETMPETSNYMISTFQAQSLIWLARLIGAQRGEYCWPVSVCAAASEPERAQDCPRAVSACLGRRKTDTRHHASARGGCLRRPVFPGVEPRSGCWGQGHGPRVRRRVRGEGPGDLRGAWGKQRRGCSGRCLGKVRGTQGSCRASGTAGHSTQHSTANTCGQASPR
jgi:hypothetical protein